MRQRSHFFLCITLLALSLAACRPSSTARSGSLDGAAGDTVPLRYAENLLIIRHADYTEVQLRDPWHEGKTLHTYYLVEEERGKRKEERDMISSLKSELKEYSLSSFLFPLSSKAKRSSREHVLTVPLRRALVTTAAHCQLLVWLGAGEAIGGVCDLKYIHVPEIQQRAAAQTLADCGDGMAPTVERIIEFGPDAVLLSPFENSGGYGKMEQLGCPIVECADYMETSALGRAEWMKFYGLLFGQADRADSLFNVVCQEYDSLRNNLKTQKLKNSILTERKTGSVWYCPGGRSTVARLIADAGGSYAFSDDQHSGSLALSAEEVLAEAGATDVWAFKFDGPRPLTREELLAEYHGYSQLRAFQTGRIYQCNTREKPFFEQVSFRPDWLLRDFILMLHPALSALGPLRYYELTTLR